MPKGKGYAGGTSAMKLKSKKKKALGKVMATGGYSAGSGVTQSTRGKAYKR